MKKTATKKTKKVTNKKSNKVIRVEHNGIVSYKAAPKQSHMTKKSKIVLISILCGLALLIAILGVVIMIIKRK